MTDRLTTLLDLQELMKALAKSPPDLVMLETKISIQLEDSPCKTIPLSTKEPSKVAHMGNNLDPK
jgi:hypothetical protein